MLTKNQIVNELFDVRVFQTNTASGPEGRFYCEKKFRVNYSATPLTPPNLNIQYVK